jgi:hypothetical protein
MRLGTYLAAAGVLVGFGLLAFRIIDLEQRVAVLTADAGTRSLDPIPTTQPIAATGAATSTKDYEARLRTIEQQLSMLATLKQGMPMPNNSIGEDRLKQEQEILSVVERENSRIREVQLEWHKSRWLETRKQQLAAFAYAQQLDPPQTTRIYEALEHELDGLADVMKRPTSAEDPDQVVSDWLKILGETDKSAQGILSPAQYQTWVQGRSFERKVLWPWLPDQPAQTAQN